MRADSYFKFFLLGLFAGVFGCSNDSVNQGETETPKLETSVDLGYMQTDKGDYLVGEDVFLSSFSIMNTSNTKTVIDKVEVIVKDLENESNVLGKNLLAQDIEIAVGETYEVEGKAFFNVSSQEAKKAYGVYINLAFRNETTKEYYGTFFRIYDDNKPQVYNIVETDYQTLPVLALQNGLSAEYAVQKSAANFVSGISHSWDTPLRPIASAPDFLERSIDRTIQFYNNLIGPTTPVESVIISTGIPGVPYVARSMKALVLPLHFLVGCDTTKEAETILDYANHNGYSTYGTLGYDYSISETTGVAWIKLLDLPIEYREFIQNHNVKNVILYGHSGVNDGETTARKIVDNRRKYEEGSLYLMHFSGANSEGFLRNVISDFDDVRLESSIKIADWEAGIVSEQVELFSNNLKTNTSVQEILYITANEGVHLWNMGTFATLAFMKKNQSMFGQGGQAVRGISLNPYLIAHPGYESYMRYIPFLYWQGFSAEFQYNNWLNTKIRTALNVYFPEIEFDNLNFYVNSTKNFGGSAQGNDMASFLTGQGLNVQNNNFLFDEAWDLDNGINAASEVRAFDLLQDVTGAEFKNWNEQLQHLLPEDIMDISNKFPEIQVIKK